MKQKDPLLGWIPIMIGLVLLAFGVFFMSDTMSSLATRSAVAEGTVVGVEITNIENRVRHMATVEFVTEGGRSIVFTSNMENGEDRIGESVTVRYNPAAPINASIYSFSKLWSIPILFFVIGGVAILFGIRNLVK